MALLQSPDDPEDLWLAVGDDVPAHRMLMQGDVVLSDVGPLLVVTHACSMRRGHGLHDTQMAAPIENRKVLKWDGSFDWMPLPAAPVPGFDNAAGLLRVLRSVDTSLLMAGVRVAVMSHLGIQLLQQRLAHHLTRVAIDTAELAEHCAPIFAEAELHEDWLSTLGEDAETQFHELLDSDDRKLRSWLRNPAMRPQAMTRVRREIRHRRDG